LVRKHRLIFSIRHLLRLSADDVISVQQLLYWIELASRKKIMAYSRFASLNESELLADKDSESTKKPQRGK
jgi:hypothetical protein